MKNDDSKQDETEELKSLLFVELNEHIAPSKAAPHDYPTSH